MPTTSTDDQVSPIKSSGTSQASGHRVSDSMSTVRPSSSGRILVSMLRTDGDGQAQLQTPPCSYTSHPGALIRAGCDIRLFTAGLPLSNLGEMYHSDDVSSVIRRPNDLGQVRSPVGQTCEVPARREISTASTGNSQPTVRREMTTKEAQQRSCHVKRAFTSDGVSARVCERRCKVTEPMSQRVTKTAIA